MGRLSHLARPCSVDGCFELVTGGAYCDVHERPRAEARKAKQRERDQARPERVAYSRDRRWQRVRRLVREREHDRCQGCGADTSGKGQANVDHRDGLGLTGPRAYDPDNCVLLCRSCHSRKTAQVDGGFGHRKATPDDLRRQPGIESLPGFDPSVDL